MTADGLHLHDLAAVEQHLAGDGLRLLQVGARHCGVCHALRPRVLALAAEFGQVHPAIVELDEVPELASRLHVLTVPVVLLYLQGRELYRAARFVRLDELRQQLAQGQRWLE